MSDGSEGKAIRFANDGTPGEGYSGAGNYLCNIPALSPSTTYTLRVVMKVTDSNESNIRTYDIGCNKASEASTLVATADGQWHTYDYTFTTGEDVTDPVYFNLGTHISSPFLMPQFEILIESVALAEGEVFPDNVDTGDTTVIFAVAFAK